MPKKIVICCDGTGNQFGDQNSNVIKLYKALDSRRGSGPLLSPGRRHDGLLAAPSPISARPGRSSGLAFGYGVSDNISDAYQFLMQNFEESDQVYVFGFSRAPTPRAPCAGCSTPSGS